MRERDGGTGLTSRSPQIRDEQAGFEKGIEKCLGTASLAGALLIRPAAGGGFAFCAVETNQIIHRGIECTLRLGVELAENFLRPPCDRTLHAADFLIRRVGHQSGFRATPVKFLEGEFQQGKCPWIAHRRVTQDVVETAFYRILFVGQSGGLRGLADEGGDFRRNQRGKLIGAMAAGELDEFRDFLQPCVEIAAQGGKNPGTTAAGENRQYGDESLATGGIEILGENLLQLVHHQCKPCAGCARQPLGALERCRGMHQGLAHKRSHGLRSGGEFRSQPDRVAVFQIRNLRKFRQGIRTQQSGRQPDERVVATIARPSEAAPNQGDILDHAGSIQQRKNSGSEQ